MIILLPPPDRPHLQSLLAVLNPPIHIMYFRISQASILLAGVIATIANVNAAPIPRRQPAARDVGAVPKARSAPYTGRSTGALAAAAAKRNIVFRRQDANSSSTDEVDDLPMTLMSTSTSDFIDDPFCFLVSNSKRSVFDKSPVITDDKNKREPTRHTEQVGDRMKKRLSAAFVKRHQPANNGTSSGTSSGASSGASSASVVLSSTATSSAATSTETTATGTGTGTTTTGTGAGTNTTTTTSTVDVEKDGVGELVQFEFEDGPRVFTLGVSLGLVFEGDGALYSFFSDSDIASTEPNICLGVVRVPIPDPVDAASQSARAALVAGLSAFIQLDSALDVIYATSSFSTSQLDAYYILVPLSVASS